LVSSEAARVAAFGCFFADRAAVAGGTARSRARRSCVPSNNGRHVGDTSRVPKGASITATAIGNFDDCGEVPSGGA
jgi:hypothetical protein